MDSIRGYFSDKTVFVTGGTGTVGKVVLEKILRSCSEIKKVFVLLRPKFRAGTVMKDRLNDFINEPVFENLRRNNPSVLGKLIAIDGDLEQPGLGISSAQREQLLTEVQIVIHMGANVKFDLPLLEAMKVNVGGTCGLLDIFSNSTQDLIFIYVSTLFLRPHDTLEERVYDLDIDFDQLENLMANDCVKEANELETKLLQRKCNSYIYSKTVAEYTVKRFESKFPIAIIRLPIVGPCLREPFPGFLDSKLTFAAFFLTTASGVLPYAFVKQDCVADLVPADFCANGILAGAWYRATQASKKHTLVFNLTRENSFTWGNITDAGNVAASNYTTKEILWFPRTRLISSLTLFKLVTILFNYLPAMFLDFIAIFRSKPPKALQTVFKVQRGIQGFRNFSNRNWNFSKENIQMLRRSMNDGDREQFPTGGEKINLKTYMDVYGKAARKYVFKLSEADDAACLQAFRRSILLEVLRYSFVLALVVLLVLYGVVIHYFV